jgi:hypothetical protein
LDYLLECPVPGMHEFLLLRTIVADAQNRRYPKLKRGQYLTVSGSLRACGGLGSLSR